MSNVISTNIDEYRVNPVRWIEVARQLAEDEGKTTAPAELEAGVRELERPVFHDPTVARKEFWALLALPHRDVGLRWLDRLGLLGELIPCWDGNAARRHLRLDACEQVHLEAWKPGLNEHAFKVICDVHDVVIDRRLNRWALTALATLFAGGDTENQNMWAKRVRRDLHEFGATEAELVWIERIIREFNPALLYLENGNGDFTLRPEHVVSCISTLQVMDKGAVPAAIDIANKALADVTSPLDKSGD